MITAVHLPETVEDAVRLGRKGGMLLAGGTVVMPDVNTSVHEALELVSLRHLGLDDIQVDRGRATLGATATLAALERSPDLAFLRPALATIASPTIRHMATVAGNLFAQAPYGDLATCLMALDAQVTVAARDGVRTCPVADVIDGRLDVGDLITQVAFDVPADTTWRYHKAMRRKLNSSSVVTVAAVVDVDEGRVTQVRIALSGVGPRSVRARSAEQALLGQPLDREHVEAAAQAAREDADPFTDAYASAWYRERVLPVHVRRALFGQ